MPFELFVFIFGNKNNRTAHSKFQNVPYGWLSYKKVISLLRRLELGFDLRRGSRGDQADDNADDERGQEGGQQLVDAEHAAQRADEVLPDEDHQTSGQHPGQCALPVAALPEQRTEHHRAECAAEPGPRKADDAKDAGIRVAGQHHAHHADADDGQAGCEEALLLAQLEVAELLQNVLGHAGRSGQHLAVRRGHSSRQDACKDESGEDCRQHTVLADEAGDADDEGLTGRAAEEFQRTDPGHAEAHHADDDGGRHGDDHPHRGDAAAQDQLFLVLNGHEAEQDVGHSEVAQTPRHGGHDVQQAVRGGRVGVRIVAGQHGQVAGQALRIGDHSVPAACHAHAVDQHGDERQRHDDGLDEIGGGHGAEAAQNGVPHDDEGRDQHRRHVIHAEQAVEQLAAGRKARCRVGHKEDDDDDRAQCIEQVALVMEPQR